MKVILSRKGFDSECGGCPSPILPDGRLISLPIPDEDDDLSYSQLVVDNHKTYHELMLELGIIARMHPPCTTCHLDPDIYRRAMPRDRTWKPLFGQIDTAALHLKGQGIDVDDLFLFFGWFKQTEYVHGKISFAQKAPDLHVVFGYLQVGEIMRKDSIDQSDDWMQYHPHVRLKSRKSNKTNTLYVARENLSFCGNLPGAAPFNFCKELVLTKDGFSRSKWDLDPKIFRNVKISYHPNPWKWGYFQSACRGQEFVIQKNDAISNWSKSLIDAGMHARD